MMQPDRIKWQNLYDQEVSFVALPLQKSPVLDVI
jgi:hypothetical protein